MTTEARPMMSKEPASQKTWGERCGRLQFFPSNELNVSSLWSCLAQHFALCKSKWVSLGSKVAGPAPSTASVDQEELDGLLYFSVLSLFSALARERINSIAKV
jgi:hypothetical protein